MSGKAVFLIITSLLFCQLVYSFLFPACGFGDSWQPISTYLPKFSTASSDNFILSKVYPLISKDYRLNSDVGNYLELARNFGPQIFDGHIFTNRPLYPFLIFILSLPPRIFMPPSYGMIFGLSILLNFILIVSAVWLFWRLLKDIFSPKVAWVAAVLLIFSPYVHASLTQPLAEMLMVLAVILSVYLLHNYIKKPSVLKLIIFSLVVGIFMLGKMFFATSFFILMMALYFKRYREGVVFGVVQILPLFLWHFWVTQIWGLNYFVNEVQNWQMGVWLINVFHWPWYKTSQVFLSALPNFITALIYGFLLLPVFFSVVGFQKLPFRAKNIIYFGSFSSVFLLCFIMNLYLYRHAFLLFPIIYPTAVLGMETIAAGLKKYRPWCVPIFWTVALGLIILVSNINIYKIIDYLKS